MGAVQGKSTTYYVISSFNHIIYLLFIAIYVPYCLWIYYADRQQPYTQKRRPILIYSLIITNIVISGCMLSLHIYTKYKIMHNITFYIISVWVIGQPDICLFEFITKQWDGLEVCFMTIFVSMTAIILTLRVWLLFYDLKYAEAILKHSWWENISDETDWFIKNRNK